MTIMLTCTNGIDFLLLLLPAPTLRERIYYNEAPATFRGNRASLTRLGGIQYGYDWLTRAG